MTRRVLRSLVLASLVPARASRCPIASRRLSWHRTRVRLELMPLGNTATTLLVHDVYSPG